MISGSIAAQMRLGGAVGTQEHELERITIARYILKYITAKMKPHNETMTQVKSDSAFLRAVLSSLPSWCSDELPKQSLARDSRAQAVTP